MTETTSLRSSASSSSRYRTISKKSSIDESLFGSRSQRKSKLQIGNNTTNEPALFLNNQVLSEIRNNAKESKFSVSNSDYSENDTFIAKLESTHNHKASEKAKARKEYMIQLELQRSKQAKPFDPEKDTSINKEIDKQRIKNEDIFKQLNSCKTRAISFYIRDKQIEDKKIAEKQEKDYEKMMDLETEIHRLNEIKKREKYEEEKNQKRISDRKIIETQIEERHQQRLLEEEAMDQENRKMLEAVKRYEEEEAAKDRKRKEQARIAKMDILARNEEILKEREAKKAYEKEEEEMILAYLIDRDEKLRQREEEEEKEKQAKIKLQKKLLESQTKILDKRSEIDELRARRAAEEKERKHRQREIMEAQKRKRETELILASRRQQEEERKMNKEQEKQEQLKEYRDALDHAAEMSERERREIEIAQNKKEDLRSMLQNQIKENELSRNLNTKDKYKEGLEFQKKKAADRKMFESIRDQMVNEMRSEGIKEIYFTELLHFDFDKMLST